MVSRATSMRLTTWKELPIWIKVLTLVILLIPFLDFYAVFPGSPITLFPVLGAPLSCVGITVLRNVRRIPTQKEEITLCVFCLLLSLCSLFENGLTSFRSATYILIIPYVVFVIRLMVIPGNSSRFFIFLFLLAIIPHALGGAGVEDSVNRSTGAHRDANFAALQLLCPAVVSLGFVVKNTFSRVFEKAIVIGILCFSIYLILATGSRGGLVGLFAGYAFLLIYRYKSPLLKVILFGGLFAIFLFFAGGGAEKIAPHVDSEGVVGKLLKRMTSDELSDGSGRLEMWSWTIKECFTQIDGLIYPLGSESVFLQFGQYVHNTYLEFILILGVFLSLPFAFFFSILGYKTYRGVKLEIFSWERILLISCAIAIMCSAFFLSASGTKLVWFAIAILCAHSAIARYESFAGNQLGFWR